MRRILAGESYSKSGTRSVAGVDESLERIRKAVSRAVTGIPEIAAVYLYGSQVSGNALPISDIDLAIVLSMDVIPDDPLLAERVAVRVAEQLETSLEVDAHVVDRLPLAVLGRVVTTGILLFERDPSRRVEFETSTRRLYFDFLPFLERDAREGLRSGG
jgi:predicted nucleotidyltransferase